MRISKNDLSITSTEAVSDICVELFRKTPISYFYQTKYFHDGSCFSLNSNPNWHTHFYNNEYYPDSNYFKKLPHEYYEIMESYNSQSAHEARELFGLDNFFAIYSINNEYAEITGFATNLKEKGMIDYYFKNVESLKNFSFYFKEKARPLIQKFSNVGNRFVLPNFNVQDLSYNLNNEKTKLLFFNDQTDYLTARELICAKLCAIGLTAKEIGKQIKISPRTAEIHIRNIKQKFQLSSKVQICALLISNNLDYKEVT